MVSWVFLILNLKKLIKCSKTTMCAIISWIDGKTRERQKTSLGQVLGEISLERITGGHDPVLGVDNDLSL